MNRTFEKKSTLPVIIIYSFVFYGIWSLWEFWGNGAVNSAVENEYFCQFIKEGIIKVLVWTVPAVCLAHYFKDELYIGLKDIFTNRVNVLKLPVFFRLYRLPYRRSIFDKRQIRNQQQLSLQLFDWCAICRNHWRSGFSGLAAECHSQRKQKVEPYYHQCSYVPFNPFPDLDYERRIYRCFCQLKFPVCSHIEHNFQLVVY